MGIANRTYHLIAPQVQLVYHLALVLAHFLCAPPTLKRPHSAPHCSEGPRRV